ncbi:hypothetical protein [Microcoleus sp. S36b_A4]
MLMKLAVTLCGPPFKQVKATVRLDRSSYEQNQPPGRETRP